MEIATKNIPPAPAFLVFHDAYDGGAMEVWPVATFADAEARAKASNEKLDAEGMEECGHWNAYRKLPRVRTWKYHPEGVR